MTDSILGGIGEFFTQNGCYVHHFLEDPTPHIKIRRHKTKSFVECQIVDGKLRMLFQRGDPNYLKAWDKMGKPSGISAARPRLPVGSQTIDLSHPDSLDHALRYVKKTLFPAVPELRGGLSDRVRHQRVRRPAPSPEAGQADS